MFGISGTELMIILFFGFLIFGPEKLPQMGRTVGRAIRQFKNASEAANKKFKEEVADPFHEAIAPYKEQMDEASKPFQEDINAINSTLNETKSMFTDPFKDIFNPISTAPKSSSSTVIAAGTASDPKVAGDFAQEREPMNASVGDDPFADIVSDASSADEAPHPEGKPIPQEGGSVKKSFASSLYDLDDDGDGE